MTRSAVRTLLLWSLAMLAGTAVVWNSRFSADMSFFLPASPSAEQQVLVDQLKDGAVSRLLMVAIEGGDPGQRAALSRALRAALMQRTEFVSVQNGEATGQGADRAFLFDHRYLLSPSVTHERFAVDGLRLAVSDSIDRLASPAGMAIKSLLARDPTGEFFALLSNLDASIQPNQHDGTWVSRDGERALLLLQTRAHGSDTDGQETAIALVRNEFAAVARSADITSVRLQVSGPGLFASKARATIKEEVTRLSLISSAGIVILLFIAYRSLTLLALGLIPVASGALAGIVAVSLTHGTVFGITVGFGTALIGEAVDYSIYYFLQSGQRGPAAWRERFWPTIRLGVMTSVCGFGALLFSGFPGLAQLGLYSIVGLVTAALVTRYALPPLTPATLPLRDMAPLGRLLAGVVIRLQALRWLALAAAFGAATLLFVRHGELWTTNLSVLSTVSQADAEIDMALRADIAAPDSRYLVVVNGADRESALQAAERAGQFLDPLVTAGLIGGYDSPARFLPSRQTQEARIASLPSGEELRTRLGTALAELPLRPNKLDGFIRDIEAARSQGPLTRASLDGTSLALAVDALLIERPLGWSVLLPLRPLGGDLGVTIDPAAIRKALGGQGAEQLMFIDMKAEADRLYGDYLGEAIRLSLAGFGVIVLLLAITLRSPRRLTGVLFPLLCAVAIVIAGLHLAGEKLHLLHLIGMLLIVAVGSNYALFFDRTGGHGQLDPQTLASMLVANLTTAVGFGTLALSTVPVLNAIGITVGPGAILAMVLSALFAPRHTGPCIAR
jgi:predicted exporter